MIVQLTGTLVEVLPSQVVMDVGGVGYELGVSSNTAALLPAVGEAGVTLLTRLVVREDALELYGFSSREERSLFDRLRAIGGVGSKLALSVLSTFTPAALAEVVTAQDAARMASVPGIGRKKAQRLLIELEDAFTRDPELMRLVGAAGGDTPAAIKMPSVHESVEQEATSALLSMGFTPQEAELALEGHEKSGATTLEQVVGFALRRLGGGA